MDFTPFSAAMYFLDSFIISLVDYPLCIILWYVNK